MRRRHYAPSFGIATPSGFLLTPAHYCRHCQNFAHSAALLRRLPPGRALAGRAGARQFAPAGPPAPGPPGCGRAGRAGPARGGTPGAHQRGAVPGSSRRIPGAVSRSAPPDATPGRRGTTGAAVRRRPGLARSAACARTRQPGPPPGTRRAVSAGPGIATFQIYSAFHARRIAASYCRRRSRHRAITLSGRALPYSAAAAPPPGRHYCCALAATLQFAIPIRAAASIIPHSHGRHCTGL